MATKTFVERGFLGLLFGESSVEEVESRDIEAAKTASPKGTIWFRFFDREFLDANGETLRGDPKNYSKHYMINGRPITLAKVKADPESDRILISNMECNGWEKVWRTDWGRTTQMPSDAIVL